MFSLGKESLDMGAVSFVGGCVAARGAPPVGRPEGTSITTPGRKGKPGPENPHRTMPFAR
jgi:hypothetical protein